MEEDVDVEDIFKKPSKKIKSGKKGKRVELEVVKDLNGRFSKILSKNQDWGGFSRSVGSGNRWGANVHLSKAARDTYSGDIVCPENFKFALESKGGYNDIDLCTVFGGSQSELDSFLKQAESDAERCGRKPMLMWKKDRKPRLAFLKTVDLPDRHFSTKLVYREWTAVSYEELMKENDEFFFE